MRPAFAAVLFTSVLLAACQTIPGKAPQSSGKPAAPAAARKAPAPQPAEEPERPFPPGSFYDLLVAEFALHRGDYRLALENYLEQAHATHDVGVAERATHIAEFLKADRAALDAAKLWVELEPDNAEAQFTLGSQLARAQQPLAALPHMVKVLGSGARPNFAIVAASAATQPEAVRKQLLAEFDKLLAAHPDTAELMTGKALLLQELDRKTEALALVRQVLDKNPDDTHAILIESKLLQEMGRGKEAGQRLEQMVNENPYNQRLRLQYARLLTQTDMKKAREQFAILVQQSPNDPDLLLALALVSREVGALDDAAQYFQRLLMLNQHVASAHFYLGVIHEQQGARAKAIAEYEQVPPSEEFFPAIGRVVALHLADHDLAAARKYLASMRARYPQHALRLYLFESDVLMDLHQYAAGDKLLTAALKQYPDQPNLLYARSTFSEKRHDMAKMERDLRAILKQDPDNAVALNALGYTLANSTRRYQEAYQLISRALQQKPDDPAILDSMGWVQYRLGHLQQARTYLQKAYAKFPDPEVAAHLGEVLWQLGEQQQARDIWHQALQGKGDIAPVQKVMQRFGVE